MNSLKHTILLFSALCMLAVSCEIKRSGIGSDYKKLRAQMVRTQIENRDVKDAETLRAMRTVKRHLFVPEKYVQSAYDDGPLPIGYGQTISQPYIVAYMTELIQPKPGFKVLEIGTGSGYQAAVLAEIIDSVFSIEIIPELGSSASGRLKKLGYTNTVIKTDDGYYGWEEHAPYDAIIVTAAAEYIPPPLLNQLKDGGRMVIPIGSPFMVQWLLLVEKNGVKITTHNLIPVRFVPFRRSR
jgi:protein-L-isoaspartate(D-aspartate) O-methyltransferase